MTKSQQEGWFILEDFSQGSLRGTLTVLILTKSLWSNFGFLHARQSTNTSIWLSTNQLWLSAYPITHTSKGMSNIFQVHKGFENLLRKHYIALCPTSFLYWGFCTRIPGVFPASSSSHNHLLYWYKWTGCNWTGLWGMAYDSETKHLFT